MDSPFIYAHSTAFDNFDGGASSSSSDPIACSAASNTFRQITTNWLEDAMDLVTSSHCAGLPHEKQAAAMALQKGVAKVRRALSLSDERRVTNAFRAAAKSFPNRGPANREIRWYLQRSIRSALTQPPPLFPDDPVEQSLQHASWFQPAVRHTPTIQSDYKNIGPQLPPHHHHRRRYTGSELGWVTASNSDTSESASWGPELSSERDPQSDSFDLPVVGPLPYKDRCVD